MGLMNPSHLFVIYPGKSEPNSFAAVPIPAFLELPSLSLAPLILADKKGSWQNSFAAANRMNGEGAMDEAGMTAVFSFPHRSDSGLEQFAISADGKVALTHARQDSPTPSLSQEGKYVLERRFLKRFGEIDSPSTAPLAHAYLLAPIAGFPAFVEFDSTADFFGLRVKAPSLNTLASIPCAGAFRGVISLMRSLRSRPR